MGFRRRIHDRLRTVGGVTTTTDGSPTITLDQVTSTPSPSFLGSAHARHQDGGDAGGGETPEDAARPRRASDDAGQKPSQELEEWLSAAGTIRRLGLRSTSMSSSIWVRLKRPGRARTCGAARAARVRVDADASRVHRRCAGRRRRRDELVLLRLLRFAADVQKARERTETTGADVARGRFAARASASRRLGRPPC